MYAVFVIYSGGTATTTATYCTIFNGSYLTCALRKQAQSFIRLAIQLMTMREWPVVYLSVSISLRSLTDILRIPITQVYHP